MKKVLKDFGALTPAEIKLRDEVGSGLWVMIGDGSLPDPDAGEERQVRASFVRYLALGGCADCAPSEKGLRLTGALIVSDRPLNAAAFGSTPGLDLESCEVSGDLGLLNCRFPDTPLLRGTKLESLFLNGSALDSGLSADRLEAKGAAILRDVMVTGEVRLLGARLGGTLDCDGACFIAVAGAGGVKGYAFSADGLEAKGDVFLRGVRTTGAVRLLGARLGGTLDCDGARFIAVEGAGGVKGYAFSADGLEAKGDVFLRGVRATGEVRLLSARLGGDLDCHSARFEAVKGGSALDLSRARVDGIFFLCDRARISGPLRLIDAAVGAVEDSADCWPTKGHLHLDRFRYDTFLGGAATDAPARLKWLALGPDDPAQGIFHPQPYEQLAKVLREMGHARDARAVLERKEHLQRMAGVGQLPDRSARRPLRRAWNWVLRWTVGYGHYPVRALGWLAALWIIGMFGYFATYRAGEFKPNNAFVLRADEWVLCGAPTGALSDVQQTRLSWVSRGDHPHQLACFEAQDAARSYPEFNAAVYSADVLLPVVALEMQQYWIPDAEKSWIGASARVLLWVQILMGWALSLLAVAGLSGVIKSDR